MTMTGRRRCAGAGDRPPARRRALPEPADTGAHSPAGAVQRAESMTTRAPAHDAQVRAANPSTCIRAWTSAPHSDH